MSVKWSQHKKLIFLILEAKNISIETINIDLSPDGHLLFLGVDRVTGRSYKLDIFLYENVVVNESKWKLTDFCVQFSISKKNKEASFWPRLTKQKEKLKFISVDWARWVDEDEALNNKKKYFDPDEFEENPYNKDDFDEMESKEIETKFLDEFRENDWE